jgi:hypothetical protein
LLVEAILVKTRCRRCGRFPRRRGRVGVVMDLPLNHLALVAGDDVALHIAAHSYRTVALGNDLKGRLETGQVAQLGQFLL